MTTERELIKRLRDTIAEIDKHMYPSQGLGDWAMSTAWERPDIEGQLDEADAYLAAPVAPADPASEPAALIRTWHKDGEQHADLCDWCDIGSLQDGLHKLYAAPVAPAMVPMTRASSQQVESNAVKCCTNRVDHPSTFILGWRAAEAFHGIKP